MTNRLEYEWKWKPAMGAAKLPSQMDTRHLFHVLRLIWNNRLPARFRVGSVVLYKFGPFYSDDYLKAAITQIATELFKRDDVSELHKEQLEQMKAHMASNVLNLLGSK